MISWRLEPMDMKWEAEEEAAAEDEEEAEVMGKKRRKRRRNMAQVDKRLAKWRRALSSAPARLIVCLFISMFVSRNELLLSGAEMAPGRGDSQRPGDSNSSQVAHQARPHASAALMSANSSMSGGQLVSFMMSTNSSQTLLNSPNPSQRNSNHSGHLASSGQSVGATKTATTTATGASSSAGSPAQNSRQLKQNSMPSPKQQQQQPGDNHMAADDAHETQAPPDEHQELARSRQQAARSSASAKSVQSSWQTVSTSISAAPRMSMAAPPPPPVGYNSHGSRQLADQQQLIQLSRQQLELEPGPLGQTERPASGAGYSYGSPAYTHITQLASPATKAHTQQSAGARHAQHQRPRQMQQLDQLARAPTANASPTGRTAQQVASSAPSRPYNAQTGGQLAAPHVTVTGTPASPCRPPLSMALGGVEQHQQQQLLLNSNSELLGSASSSSASSSAPKYVRAAAGTRLRSHLVFKVLRADSLTDCELACSRASQLAGGNVLDTCRSFNYRAYFAAENCELSRHDVRQLKLEDGAQFEQHTQFDLYALEASVQQSGQLQQQQQQLAVPGHELADCLDVSQSCSAEGMEFTLRTSEPFSGRIYTYGFHDSCFFDADGSGATSVLKISRSNGFPRCGTQQIGDLMTNIVVVQFNDFVQTTRDKKYNLTCYFSGFGEAVVTSNYLDTKLDERSHPTQIEHLPPQNVITSNVHLRVLYRGQSTNTIAVGDLLTFRLETGQQGRESRAEPLSEIFATNVLAKDPYSGRQVELIDARGCPVDPINVFPELQRTPDGALESEFYAFKIPDSNFLIFQATVRTCKSPCEPVICHTQLATSTNLERPPTHGHHQQQLGTAPLNSGLKGGGALLGAYLMAPHQSSVPSWGRKRRRRRQTGADQTRQSDDNYDQDHDHDDELAAASGAGESIEHIIPIRTPAAAAAHQELAVQHVRRPDLSEAEEEVKEMFRVYLSRAEIGRQQERHGLQPDAAHRAARPLKLTGVNLGQPESSGANWDAAQARGPDEVAGSVCLNSFAYYVMLFALIALTLILLGVLLVAALVTRKAKFRVSNTLADSMF